MAVVKRLDSCTWGLQESGSRCHKSADKWQRNSWHEGCPAQVWIRCGREFWLAGARENIFENRCFRSVFSLRAVCSLSSTHHARWVQLLNSNFNIQSRRSLLHVELILKTRDRGTKRKQNKILVLTAFLLFHSLNALQEWSRAGT